MIGNWGQWVQNWSKIWPLRPSKGSTASVYCLSARPTGRLPSCLGRKSVPDAKTLLLSWSVLILSTVVEGKHVQQCNIRTILWNETSSEKVALTKWEGCPAIASEKDKASAKNMIALWEYFVPIMIVEDHPGYCLVLSGLRSVHSGRYRSSTYRAAPWVSFQVA